MTDSELRDLVLKNLYELRQSGKRFLTANNPPLVSVLSLHETLRICSQLDEDGLVQAKLHKNSSTGNREYVSGTVEITARGVDIVEGNESRKVKFMQTNHISVNNSSNVVVGDHNRVTVNQHIAELERIVDGLNGTPEQKAEAKSLLKRFAEHPLVAAVVSGGVSLLGGE